MIKRFAILSTLVFAALSLNAQTSCVAGNGVTCSPNRGLWILPYAYNNRGIPSDRTWDVPMNANSSILDVWSATVPSLTLPT